MNSLASAVFDLSPLDLSHERPINPDNIANTCVDNEWLINQIKSRFVVSSNTNICKVWKLKVWGVT